MIQRAKLRKAPSKTIVDSRLRFNCVHLYNKFDVFHPDSDSLSFPTSIGKLRPHKAYKARKQGFH